MVSTNEPTLRYATLRRLQIRFWPHTAVAPVGKDNKKNKSKGREALGGLAGHDKKYVDDVMETAELTRHHNDPNARQVLTEEECRSRARILIDAYANSI
jgi:hypothetical protein